MLKTIIVRLFPVLGMIKHGPLPRRSFEKMALAGRAPRAPIVWNLTGLAGQTNSNTLSLCHSASFVTPILLQQASTICYLHLFSIACNNLFDSPSHLFLTADNHRTRTQPCPSRTRSAMLCPQAYSLFWTPTSTSLLCNVLSSNIFQKLVSARQRRLASVELMCYRRHLCLHQ